MKVNDRMSRMKKLITLLALFVALAGVGLAEDHKDYQMGTYVRAHSVADGTITSTIHGDGTTVAGGVYENRVTLYTVKVADGMWRLETARQAGDSMMRGMGWTPAHIKSEKPNPLDFLKDGDRVLFRVERHKKIGGTETDVFIPYADQPNKECKFIGTFIPAVLPGSTAPRKPTDNVRAMCEAHKLSPEQEKQFCNDAEAAPPALATGTLEQAKKNTEDAKNSPAAAAALARDGHTRTPQENEELVKEGKASRCAFITNPSGAEIFIDGNKAGVTPFALVLVKLDKPRVVTFKLVGYKTVEKEYDPDGKLIPVALTLEKENP